MKKLLHLLFRFSYSLVLTGMVVSTLFVLNGILFARNERPVTKTTSAVAQDFSSKKQVKIMSFNIAKAFVNQHTFTDTKSVEDRLQKIAAIINQEKPDYIFLSETLTEFGCCQPNQVEKLANLTGMHTWIFGENFNFGIPFFRAVGGNAILSSSSPTALTNFSLSGRKPFYITKNNRRVLVAKDSLSNREVLLLSIHNDSLNLENNARQMQEILEYVGEKPAIMAGDFNAQLPDPAIQAIIKTEKFQGHENPVLTFNSAQPFEQIDFIFVPRNWKFVTQYIVASDVSDHLPLVAVYEITE